MRSKSRSNNSFSSLALERWLEAYRERNSGGHLFELPSVDGSLSGFWFWSPSGSWPLPWPEEPAERLFLGKALLTLLCKLQTTRPFTIDFYGGQLNAANLGTGQILLDGTILLDPELGKTFTERLDILAGLALHEVAHIKFTEPELARKALVRSKVFYLVAMILEDESVECRLGREAPGLVDFFQRTKEHMFTEQLDRVPAPKDDYQELLAALLLFVRYPLALSPEMLTKWQGELEFVAEVLTPFPDTDEGVWQAAEQIVERLFKTQEEEEQQKRAGGQPPTIIIPMPGRAGGIHPPSSIEEFIERMAQHSSMAAVKGEVLQGLRDLEQALANALRGRPFPFPVPSGDGTCDPPGPIEFIEAPQAREVYLRDLAAVRAYIPRLRRNLLFREIEHKEILRRQEMGRLERRMLYAIPLGEERVFQQVKEEMHRKVTVILLVDESGSMAGDKIERARQAAILLKEVLERMRGVDLYIYGHAADIGTPGTTQIFRYYSPGCGRRYSLGSIKARANNRDGVALEAVAREVLKKASRAQGEETLMIILSDGIPAAHGYGGLQGIEHTRRAVQRLQRAGISVIQVAIPPHGEPQRMFDQYLVLSDLGSLPQEIGRLLRRLLLRRTLVSGGRE